MKSMIKSYNILILGYNSSSYILIQGRSGTFDEDKAKEISNDLKL